MKGRHALGALLLASAAVMVSQMRGGHDRPPDLPAPTPPPTRPVPAAPALPAEAGCDGCSEARRRGWGYAADDFRPRSLPSSGPCRAFAPKGGWDKAGACVPPFPSADTQRYRQRGRMPKAMACSCRDTFWHLDGEEGTAPVGMKMSNSTLLFSGDSTVHNMFKVLERELSREGWKALAERPADLPPICGEWVLDEHWLRLCMQRLQGTMPLSPLATSFVVDRIKEGLGNRPLTGLVTGPSVHYIKGGRALGHIPGLEPGAAPESLGAVRDAEHYLERVVPALPPAAVLLLREAEPQGFPGPPYDGLYKGWEGIAGSKNELNASQVAAMGLNMTRLRQEHFDNVLGGGGSKCSAAGLQPGFPGRKAGRVVDLAFRQVLQSKCEEHASTWGSRPRVVLLRTRRHAESGLAGGVDRWWGWKMKVAKSKGGKRKPSGAGGVVGGVLDCVHLRCANVHRMELKHLAEAVRALRQR